MPPEPFFCCDACLSEGYDSLIHPEESLSTCMCWPWVVLESEECKDKQAGSLFVVSSPQALGFYSSLSFGTLSILHSWDVGLARGSSC